MTKYRPHLRTRPIRPTILSPSGLDVASLDSDALRSLQRIQARGYEAYLVGGCVRDLLLGRKPKDFDMATGARPAQIKRTFPRNCRIIGRRFKLAHLHFDNNRKIIEVSTFRRAPIEETGDSQDLLITQDNEFGNAEEDAVRRDFTVNALFLDPVRNEIIDYVDGLADIQNRLLRTIGTPVVRFREDPVRILRAAKFAGRLGLQIDASTWEAMAQVAPDLTRSAAPRILEEVLRLLRGGHSLDSFQILRDIGALKVMLPVVGNFLARAPEAERVLFWRILESMDSRVESGQVLGTPVLLGALFVRPVLQALSEGSRQSPASIIEGMLGSFTRDLRLSRRDAGCLKRICAVQPRFHGNTTRRFKTSSFLLDPYFPEALALFEMTVAATGEGLDTLEDWRQQAAEVRPDMEFRDDGEQEFGFDPEPQEGDEDERDRPRSRGSSGWRSDHPEDVPDLEESESAGSREAPDRDPDEDEDEDEDARSGGDDDSTETRVQSEGGEDPGRKRRRRRRRKGRGARTDETGPVPEREFAEAEPSDEQDSMRDPQDAPLLDEPIQAGTDTAQEPRKRRRRRRKGRGGSYDEPAGQGRDEHQDTGQPLLVDDEDTLSEGPEREGADPVGPRSEDEEHRGEQAERTAEGGPETQRRKRRGRRKSKVEGQPQSAPQRNLAPAQDRGPAQNDGRRGNDGGRREGPPQRQQSPRNQPAIAKDRRDDRGGRGGRRDKPDRKNKRHDGHRPTVVEEIEPVVFDRSIFDMELDPRRVPTFGVLVDDQSGKRRRRPPPSMQEEKAEGYRPPPAPGSEPAPTGPPPPPPPVDDTFGDW